MFESDNDAEAKASMAENVPVIGPLYALRIVLGGAWK